MQISIVYIIISLLATPVVIYLCLPVVAALKNFIANEIKHWREL
jgi:hypothetical protein